MAIPWIVDGESVVGQNHPTLIDVANRPLKYIITQSGLDSAAAFNGFIAKSPPAAQVGDINLVGNATIVGVALIGTTYVSINPPRALQASYFSAATNNSLGTLLYIKQTVANANTIEGAASVGESAHTAGTIVRIVGLTATFLSSGVGGATTGGYGLWGDGRMSAGTVTSFYAVRGGAFINGATVGTVAAFYAPTVVVTSGTLTSAYGILIEDVTAGGTNNIAIKTGVGLVILGDETRLDHGGNAHLEFYIAGARKAGVSVVGADEIRFTDSAGTVKLKLNLGGTTGKIIPPATSLSFRDTADANDNVLILDNGIVALRNVLSFVGTDAYINVDAAKKFQFLVNGTAKFIISAAGVLTLSGTPGFAAGDKYLIIDAGGNVHVSALGPAS